jgi:hypothetical protein
MLAEAGCPEGSEPFGVLIEKSALRIWCVATRRAEA